MAFGGLWGGPPFDPLNNAGRVRIPGFVDDDDDPPLQFGVQNVEGGEAIYDLLINPSRPTGSAGNIHVLAEDGIFSISSENGNVVQ
jgi:hypothetical protein